MWCSLRDSFSFGEEQLTAVKSFLLSTTSDSSSTSDQKKSDRDDVSSDSEDDALSSENVDTEKPAAVADWDDWGEGQEKPREVPHSPLIKRSRGSIERENAKWLHTSLIGCAPLLDIIVLAREDRFVVLERGEEQFNIACQKRVEKADESDEIWSIAVLPIASSRKTETKPYDWTAIVVGLSSGMLHFYTERGVLVFVEQFARSPALSIRFGQGLHSTQELVVLYKDCLAVIEGLSLYTALRSCRSQVARGMASVESLSEMVELNFRKFRFPSASRTDDVAVSGPIKPSSFDQYETASILGGFYTRLHRTSLPFYSTYILAGSEPFLTFSWYEEGGGQPVLSDAIYNLAGKLKSSVAAQMPSFGLSGLFGGHSRNEKPKINPVDVRSTELPARSQIKDSGRVCDKVFLAPGGRLAAVADAQARIMLINTSLRQVVRVWKGYRDASCAWIESFGEVSQTNKKTGRALFLIIYAPRRGLLEVWAMQNGPRVSAFNVDKKGRLLTISRPDDVILGGTSGSERDVPSATSAPAAAFFVATDGRILEIVAPFHLALQDESAASAHDENLIREIRAVLGAGPLLPNDVAESRLLLLIGELKTIAAKRRALDLILDMGRLPVSTVGRIVESLRTALAPSSNSTVSKSVEAQTFLPHLNVYSQLVNAFAFVDKFHKQVDDVDSTGDESDEEESSQSIADLLKLSPEQLREDLSRLERCRRRHQPAEKTTPLVDFSFTDLIACFDFAHLQHFPSLAAERQNSTSTTTDWISNKLKYPSAALGRFLFAPALLGRCSVGDLINRILPQFGLDQSALIRLFCAHWLHTDAHQITLYLPRVYRLVKALADMNTKSSDWLAIAQSEIVACPLVAESFSLCLIVRAVALSAGELKMDADDMDESAESTASNNWEPVQIVLEKWDVLLTHLRCLATLQTLPGADGESINELIARGFGFYREKIGRWAAVFSPEPATLLKALNDATATTTEEKDVGDATASLTDDWQTTIGELRNLFPLSLSPEAVLCDCAWEAASAWSREPDGTDRLNQALEMLALVDQPVLRHGIAFLMWDTLVQSRFRQLADLLDKIGKFPKDRLSRKDVGVSETKLGDFAHCCHQLLRLLCNAAADRDYAQMPTLRYEDFLEGLFDLPLDGPTTQMRREPLCELAARQKTVNYHLVLHHAQLAAVIELQLEMALRARPSSLFDDKGRRAMFLDLHSHPLIPLADVDDQIRAARQKFVEQCVKAAVDAAASAQGGRMVPNCAAAVELAKEWQLDVDRLRADEIIALYRMGRDTDGERLLPLVQDRLPLGDALLPLLGERLKHLLARNDSDALSHVEKYSLISTRTVEWLRSLPESVAHEELQLDCDNLKRLAKQVESCLSSAGEGNPGKLAIVNDLNRLIEHI